MLNDMLGVAIGIFLVYLLLSLILSTFIDWWSRRRGWRAKILQDWIERLLEGKVGSGIVDDVLRHPLISVLFGEKGNRPATIPARNFALALLDTLSPARTTEKPGNLAEIRNAIRSSDKCGNHIKDVLLVLIDQAQGQLDKAIKNIEEWFNDPGHTSATRYRWRVQVAVFIVALVISSVLNLDTIMIAGELWRQPALRDSAAAVAEGLSKDLQAPERDALEMEMGEILDTMKATQIPIGWCTSCDERDPRRLPNTGQGWLLKIFGILATTLSTSLGAPFWFDMLRKIVHIRQDLQQPEAAQTKAPAETPGETQ